MSEPYQSGFSDNAAGAISYITILPAIVFLVMPPYNKRAYVRFHSWQSIFLTIAWVAVFIVLGILDKIPFIGAIAWPLFLVLAAVWFVIWIVLVLKALNGNLTKLPIIGDLAQKQAGS